MQHTLFFLTKSVLRRNELARVYAAGVLSDSNLLGKEKYPSPFCSSHPVLPKQMWTGISKALVEFTVRNRGLLKD
jgi:hypothetical protein